MLSTTNGPTYEDAKKAYGDYLKEWRPKIEAVAELLARMNTNDAEIAATVHFAAKQLTLAKHRKPTEMDVLKYVMDWKKRKRPPLKRGRRRAHNSRIEYARLARGGAERGPSRLRRFDDRVAATRGAESLGSVGRS
jgi:hypothetical protein